MNIRFARTRPKRSNLGRELQRWCVEEYRAVDEVFDTNGLLLSLLARVCRLLLALERIFVTGRSSGAKNESRD
jgi:hypothetical protein